MIPETFGAGDRGNGLVTRGGGCSAQNPLPHPFQLEKYHCLFSYDQLRYDFGGVFVVAIEEE